MKIKHKSIRLKTKDFCEFIDLTDEVKTFLNDSKILNGQVTIFSKHTTLAIRINEREKGLLQDFKDHISQFVPKDAYYRHNDLTIRTENLVCDPGASDCLNGHSHILHFFTGTSETVPVVDGKLLFGTWQRIFAIELDCARPREVFLQIIGE